jgi:hypothetical protein
VLTATIKNIFPHLEEKSVGKYDAEELKEMWILK